MYIHTPLSCLHRFTHQEFSIPEGIALIYEEIRSRVVNVVKNADLKSYWSHELAKVLNISTSTLRKWSIALEAAGYSFIRDENDKRAYLEQDIMPLQKMRELLSDGMGMDNAAKAVVLRFSDQTLTSGTMAVRQQDARSSEHYSELITQVEELKGENKEIRDYLERIEKRMQEQHEGITQLLREQLEVRKMIAAANEKKWWKFWL